MAAPIGPINVLCIRRTLQYSSRYGLVTGLGAAAADGVFAIIAGLGVRGITPLLINYEQWVRLFGGIILLFIGWHIFKAEPKNADTSPDNRSYGKAFAGSFFLTATNPMTILGLAAIFAGLGMAGLGSHERSQAIALVGGVALGSAIWWVILSFGVSFLKKRIEDIPLKKINQISGLIVLVFGFVALVSAISHWL